MVYGYTNEYQGSYNYLVYLRARHYAPAMGRFLSRDTWAGDYNRPMSYNRWMYGYGNPIAWTDPTGMSPECDVIAGSAGDSYLKCEKIIRDIDPRNDWTLNKVLTYDLFKIPDKNSGDDCLPSLFWELPIPFSYKDIDASETYGFWFHFLLNNTRGGWNSGGRSPTTFLAVAALAVSNELGHAEGLRNQIMGMAVEAFVRKGWTGGFYRMIGSRQVVREAVDTAILFPRNPGATFSPTRLRKRNANGDYSFENARNAFLSRIDAFNLNGGLIGVMDDGLGNPAYHNDGGGNSPYDCGNPTRRTNERFPLFMDALKRPLPEKQKLTGENEIYFRTGWLDRMPDSNYYPVFFVLTQKQQSHWCAGYSCVVP